MNKIAYNFLSITLCEIVGLSGGAVSSTSVSTWYRKLRKPSFSPPSWIFGPVWTTLYALMGVAAVSVAEKREKDTKRANLLFGTQLFLNFLWTVLFFGFRSPFAAFVEITALHISILITISTYWRLSKKAAFLMIPYILWVSFASVLNFKVWRLNK